MLSPLYRFMRPLAMGFFPSRCLLCDFYSEADFCYACLQTLPVLGPHCPRCGKDTVQVCGTCLHHPPYFNHFTACFPYIYPIDHWIMQLKFYHVLHWSRILSHFLLPYIKRKPELIIPVPLHPKRLQERGFNQALEIAKPLSKILSVPLATQAIVRIKHTAAQLQLPAKEREHNIKNAFALQQIDWPKHVAIVDDVFTTGATVNEMSRLLKKAGVEYIDIWCIARAQLG